MLRLISIHVSKRALELIVCDIGCYPTHWAYVWEAIEEQQSPDWVKWGLGHCGYSIHLVSWTSWSSEYMMNKYYEISYGFTATEISFWWYFLSLTAPEVVKDKFSFRRWWKCHQNEIYIQCSLRGHSDTSVHSALRASCTDYPRGPFVPPISQCTLHHA